MSEGEQDKGQGPPLARYTRAGKYEAFTTKWHYYLKEKQNAARESEDDAFRQQISMNILKLFYLLPYDGNTIFIHSLQLEWSLQQTSIKQKHILTGEAVARSENTTKSIFCGNFLRAAALPCFFISFRKKTFLLRRRPGRLPGSHASASGCRK